MRKIMFGLAGAAALGLAAFTPQPAQAQGFSIQFGSPGYYGRPVYGPGYGAYGYGPPCFVRVVRYWDGYGWVRERRRVCR